MRIMPVILKHYPLKRGKGLLLSWFMPDPSGIPVGSVMTTREHLKLALRGDSIYCGVYLFGEYEPWNTALFKKLIEPGNVVFDIGANFGWYTTLFAKLAGPAGRIYAFEPQAAIVEHNRENLRLNGFEERVELSNLALGAQPGSLDLYTFSGLSHAHSSASALGRDDATKASCAMTTLDQFVKAQGIARVDVIKIDVEGYESDVFLGGSELLGAPEAPLIVFEINVECLSSRGLNAVDVQQVLRNLGYCSFWAINPFEGVILETGNLPALNRDYLAAKQNRIGYVEQRLSLKNRPA